MASAVDWQVRLSAPGSEAKVAQRKEGNTGKRILAVKRLVFGTYIMYVLSTHIYAYFFNLLVSNSLFSWSMILFIFFYFNVFLTPKRQTFPSFVG